MQHAGQRDSRREADDSGNSDSSKTPRPSRKTSPVINFEVIPSGRIFLNREAKRRLVDFFS